MTLTVEGLLRVRLIEPLESIAPVSYTHLDVYKRQVCVSDVFCNAGYDCAYFGKLHADFPTPNDLSLIHI